MIEQGVEHLAQKIARETLGEVAGRARCCLAEPDPDAVHELRISIRRYHQASAMLESLCPQESASAGEVAARLKDILHLAGEVRNRDLTVKLIEQLASDISQKDITDCLFEIKVSRERAALELQDSLWSYMPVLTSVPPTTFAADTNEDPATLPKEVAGQLQLTAGEYLKRGRRAARKSSTPRQQHKFRIFAKKFRYSLENFLPQGAHETHLKQVRMVQSILGDANDYLTVRGLLEHSAHISKENLERMCDALDKKRDRKVKKFRRRWRKQFGSKQDRLTWREELAHQLSARAA